MLNSEFGIGRSALGVGRSLPNCDIARKPCRFSPLSCSLVSSEWARSPLAPDTRSVRNSRFRVHAPTNAGRHRHPLLSQLAEQVSRFRFTGARFRKRSASRVARPGLLRSRAKSPRHRKNGYGSTWRKFPAAESSKCDNFPESGNTPLMQWPALPLINRFRSSKRTPVAFWPGFSICANQSIPIQAGECFGNTQRVFSQNPMPRLSTPHCSILARSFA